MDGGSIARSAGLLEPSWTGDTPETSRRTPRHNGRATKFLHPGQIIASETPCAVTSVLGSCVAVCLTDPVAGVGGLTHYLLPRPLGGPPRERYGTLAVSLLIERIISLGGHPARLRAKVFGGARMVGTMARGSGRHIGEQNVTVAFELLGERGIPLLAEDVGGDRARKLIYYTDDATAWVRRL